MPSNSPLDRLTLSQRILVAVALLIVAGIIVGIRGCQEQPGPQPGPPREPQKPLANRNVKYGYPAEAKADPASKDAYLIERPQYVLSYNDSKRIPNWVCWNLNKADIGNTKRAVGFDPDPDLPKSFVRVKHSDYTGFGFDRGHLCPSKDRSDTEENNKITFYTTNIMPQSPACNRGGWERFESYCRDLTRDGSELYIAAGPHGQGGTGEHGKRETIGKAGEITVPAACWKVVMVVPNSEEMPTHATRTLAVWMPNDQTVPEDWKPYAVTVAEVEKRTGYKFFPVVPDDVGDPIKSRLDRGR
jgi:endonuclease G, mitochondrial